MSFNRRNFLKGLGLIGLGASTPAYAEKVLINQNEAFSFACPPYLQNLSANAITVCAIFNKPCLAWVEVLDANNNTVKSIYQVEDGMRNANTELFKFKLDIPDGKLNYKVVAKEITKFEPYKIEYAGTIQSEPIQIAVPQQKQDSIQCLILNDIHEEKDSYAFLYDKSQLSKKDLVFLNGDSFHYVTNQADLTEKLLKPVGNKFASKTPFVMVRGNHETRGSFARDYKKYFDYPENKYYQAFRMGPIFWVVLDSGEDKPDDHEVYGGTVDYDSYRLEQKEWLTKVLNSKERREAKHTLVVTHIPFHHSDDWHGTKHNFECFHEVLNNNKVDAVISGHTHKYSFHPPDNNHNYYVIIGGGPKAGNRTYVDISATGKNLLVSLNLDDGSTINRFSKNG